MTSGGGRTSVSLTVLERLDRGGAEYDTGLPRGPWSAGFAPAARGDS